MKDRQKRWGPWPDSLTFIPAEELRGLGWWERMPPPSESHLVQSEGLSWEGRGLSAGPLPLQTRPEASLGGEKHQAGHPPQRSPDSALTRT